MSVFPWSFSAIKTFEQCPKKYFHMKVEKDYNDKPGEAALYGTMVHEAAELRVKDGTPIPKKFGYMEPIVDRLLSIKGDKYPELELAVIRSDDDFSPCDFKDEAAYYRGIADLVVVNGKKAYCFDYKTGKNSRYADMRQLDLMAGALFCLFPEVETIKSALLFVVSNDLIDKTHTRDKMLKYLTTFDKRVADLEDCVDNGIWNPKSGPLCGWCPVKECAHWRP
tara:strand:- start:12815 stop:13483 length:669 start_codon:yes stop_codon:yes gene_type:complete